MKRTILLAASLMVNLMVNAQSIQETITISKDPNENKMIMDVLPGYNRNIEVDLYEDNTLVNHFSLDKGSIAIKREDNVALYKFQLTYAGIAPSDMGIATVGDVEKVNFNSSAILNTYITTSCNASQLKYYLIGGSLFEKGCVCTKYNTLGEQNFYNLYANGQLANYLKTNGCSSSGTNQSRMAGPANNGSFVVADKNTATILNADSENKTYAIYDLLGNFISGSVCCDNKIDISMLNDGFYVMVLNTSKGTSSYKFIK